MPSGLDWSAYRAEWKWDGIRVQLVATATRAAGSIRGRRRISPTAFRKSSAAMDFHGVLDGELLVMRDGAVAPFGDLQQRLNRKAPGPEDARGFSRPASGSMTFSSTARTDLRALPFDERRASWKPGIAAPPAGADGPLTAHSLRWAARLLADLRFGARAASIEGLMLKRGDSPYLAGRPRGPWWKWKRDPLTIDAVLMYAQRGHGRRSSIYSDYTFGLWRMDGMLVPVGKAYSGITDEELAFLDRWVRNHTVARFGPVREVDKSLVLEIAFDAAQASNRHKSGVALRFPRISRIRTDKPAAEADRLESLIARIPPSGVAKGAALMEEGPRTGVS